MITPPHFDTYCHENTFEPRAWMQFMRANKNAIDWSSLTTQELFFYFQDAVHHRMDFFLMSVAFPLSKIEPLLTETNIKQMHAALYEHLHLDTLQTLTNPLHVKRYIDSSIERAKTQGGVLRMETNWDQFYTTLKKTVYHFPIEPVLIGNYLITRLQEMGHRINMDDIPHNNEINILPADAFLVPITVYEEVSLSL